jgi:hypothetical protein
MFLCLDVSLCVAIGWAPYNLVSDAAGEGCPVAAFVDWWVEDEQADRLVAYVTTVAFPGSQLTERCVGDAASVSAAF